MNEETITVENPPEEETTETHVAHHPRLSCIMPIILFSYLGAGTRLGLSLFGNIQAPLSASLWSNVIGCFIMGLIVEQKLTILPHFPQLYVGLTTGFCGSLTTFSGVMFYSCAALFGSSSRLTYPVSNYLAVILSLFSSSLVGFIFGRHLSDYLLTPSSSAVQVKKKMLLIKDHAYRWIFPILISLSTPLLIILAALLPLGPLTFVIYSLLFAPFGAVSRYFLAILFNNNRFFPLGTFLANLSGSLIYLGVISILAYVEISSFLVKQILIGCLQGFCGCLTTVSTFLLELNTINERKTIYLYLLITLIPIQIVYIVLGNLFSRLCS